METSKLAIANEYLSRAIELYFRGDSYFSAIHLAGAAQELLGKFVERGGAASAHRSIVEGAVRISAALDPGGTPSKEKDIRQLVNYAKNRVKHMDDDGDEVVRFDPQYQAREILNLAVGDFYKLWGDGADLQLSDEIQQYSKYQVERRVGT